jgi:hypothetical protein
MKPVMMLGILILFISSLFIMLIFETLVRANVACLGSPENPSIVRCDLRKYNIDIIFGFLLIAFFAVLDIVAFYLLFTGAAI